MKCPYCNSNVFLKDSSIIYGKSYGLVYICEKYPACKSYVGVHKGTVNPLGTMANEALRNLRKECHKKFDLLWKSGQMKRGQAYKWLQDAFNISKEKAHIAMFDIEMCEKFLSHLAKQTNK